MNNRKPAKIGDAVIGIALILFCIYFLVETVALPTPMDNVPGPTLFPKLILFGLLITGTWLVLSNLPLRRATAAGAAAEPGRPLAPVVGTLAAAAAYALALQAVPFLVATPAFIVVASLIALRFRGTRAQLALLGAVAVLGSVLIQVVFIHGLGIRL